MRRVVALNYKEYSGSPLLRARFFGVLPLAEGEDQGLRRERYEWGEVLVLDRLGREAFFAYTYYTPSSEAAKNALLRYAFAQVLTEKGYELKGRIGEVLVFLSPSGRTIFLATKWGGYTPAGIRRIYDAISRYLFQTGGLLWFSPAPKRLFGRFLKAHPSAEVIPEEVAKEALEVFHRLRQGPVPSPGGSG